MVEKNWEKRQVQARSRVFFDMATNFSSRAEVSIFGLKDWILDTYQRLSVEKEKNRRLDHRDLEIHGSLRGGVRNLTHAVSYILVATKYRQDITLATLELLRFASGGIIYNLHGMYEACKDYLGELDTVKAYYDFIDPDINRSSTSRIPPFADNSEPTGHGMKITGKNVNICVSIREAGPQRSQLHHRTRRMCSNYWRQWKWKEHTYQIVSEVIRCHKRVPRD